MSILSYKPELWKCENPDCENLISDVATKNLKKRFCSDRCRQHRYYKTIVSEGKLIRLTPKRCKYCKKVFRPKHKSTQKYCSRQCNWRSLRNITLTVSCQLCGNPIKPNGRTMYCSKRHALLACYKRALEKAGVLV